ncbi:hypothetical protein B0O99DRAFT_675296 [Bisporella sp. PMI_857]|nr:hypothetical protein B0O99DRAFT_675296 [Bisporella sp. PMI_857]
MQLALTLFALAGSVLAIPAPVSAVEKTVVQPTRGSPNVTWISDFPAQVLSAEASANLAALSTPAVDARSLEERNDLMYFTVFSDVNWSGRQEALLTGTGICKNLYNGWGGTISSVAPTSGYSCCMYSAQQCNGQTLCGIVAPGIADLRNYGFNDLANAYACF